MDTLKAFFMGQAAALRGQPQRVFDWDKAATYFAEQNIQEASAGLGGDWGCTGGSILRNGEPTPADQTYVYLCSNWAPPMLEIGGTRVECWVLVEDTDGWDASTYWPESALKILRSKKKLAP